MQGDQTVKCKDCSEMFTITASEAEFITSKRDENGKFYSLPKRCKKCRIAKKARYQSKEVDKVMGRLRGGEKITLQ